LYMQARYYDPAVGRFLSVDPVGPAAGNAYNFNRYDYANNNPIVNIDPDGRCSWCAVTAGAVGVALGGALIAGGIDIMIQKHYHPDQPIDKTQVGIAATAGALTAVSGAVLGAAALEGTLTVGQAVLRQAAINGAVGAAGSASNNLAKGQPVSGEAALNAAGANIAGSLISSGFTGLTGGFAGASQNGAISLMAQAPINTPAGIGSSIAATTVSVGPSVTAPSMLQAAASQSTHLGDAAAAIGEEKLDSHEKDSQ
jgi:uncharacterized protein RhaS with RHS repeats